MFRSCSVLSAILLTAAVRSVEARPTGAELFSAHGCQSCHRIGRVGGDTGPDLSFVGVRRSAEWLDRWLADPQGWKYSTLMPNLHLQTSNREALVRFLASRKGQDLDPGPRPWGGMSKEDIVRGEKIYRIVGCIACHGVGGAGGEPNVNTPGNAIPALRDLVGTYTADELRSKIAHGSIPDKVDPSGPAPVAMPSWSGVLLDDEIRSLVVYLRTFKPSKEVSSF